MRIILKRKVKVAARNLFRKQPIGLISEKAFIRFVMEDFDWMVGRPISEFVRDKWLEAASKYLDRNFPIETDRKKRVYAQLLIYTRDKYEMYALRKAAGFTIPAALDLPAEKT